MLGLTVVQWLVLCQGAVHLHTIHNFYPGIRIMLDCWIWKSSQLHFFQTQTKGGVQGGAPRGEHALFVGVSYKFFFGYLWLLRHFRAFVGYFMVLFSYKTDAQVCVRVTEGIEVEKRPVIKLWCFSPRFPRYISSCFCITCIIIPFIFRDNKLLN